MVDRPQCRDDASGNPSAFRECKPECKSQGLSSQSSEGALKSKALDSMSPIPVDNQSNADVCFSTHDTWGILDTGATKTVIGSQHVTSFLQSVKPEVRAQIQRCSCDIVFRFGNQGTLKASQAMVVPVCGILFKAAVVPGATPFLVSNTLIRALGGTCSATF